MLASNYKKQTEPKTGSYQIDYKCNWEIREGVNGWPYSVAINIIHIISIHTCKLGETYL